MGAAGVAGVPASPLLVGLLTSAGSGAFLAPTFAETLTFSADPLAYFVPGPYSTVFGGWSTPIYAEHVWGTSRWKNGLPRLERVGVRATGAGAGLAADPVAG